MSIPSLRSCMYDTSALLECFSGGDVYHFQAYDMKLITTEQLRLTNQCSYPIQGNPHWTAVKNIMKYLCNTKDMFLVYEGDIKRDLRVACYTDAGYLIDKSTKQRILATSFEEAEYIVVSNASKKDVWIRKFIYGLGVVLTNEVTMKMYCDITEAITIANEPGITKGARHYRAKVHYLREVIEFGDIVLEKVYTDDNVADPFRKALPFNKYSEHTNNIGKTKLAYAPNSKISPPPKKDNAAKDATCHQCGEVSFQ
ncbi:hypothetical protein Tco_0888193 [Tanacetum coccineum]